jgi:hypothetical protein
MFSLNAATNLNLCLELVNSEEPWAVILKSRILRNDKLISHYISSIVGRVLWSVNKLNIEHNLRARSRNFGMLLLLIIMFRFFVV